jgi:hypothetical protein
MASALQIALNLALYPAITIQKKVCVLHLQLHTTVLTAILISTEIV